MDLENTSDELLSGLRVRGDLVGSHAEALPGAIGPGRTASAVLTFPYATEWRPGLSVAKRPPSDKRVHLSYSLDDLAAHSARIKDVPPQDR